jgi:hypothetical protein
MGEVAVLREVTQGLTDGTNDWIPKSCEQPREAQRPVLWLRFGEGERKVGR